MELSISEMMVIAIAIVILFGPKKIPSIARDLGLGVRKMREAMEDIKTEIMKETDEPLNQIKKEIDNIKEAAKDYDLKEQLKKNIVGDEERKTAKENELKDEHSGPVSR